MKRQALTDQSGKWFNLDSAEKFDESKQWDGNNHVSNATNSQWEHEALYKTKGSKFILNHWSQWQGTTETWKEISIGEAAIWLSTNGHEPDETLLKEFEELEIK